MTEKILIATRVGEVMTLCLNRPEKCNALNGPLIQALQEAFVAAEADPQTRLVLLKGEGKHFCSGADIDWMRQLAQSSLEDSREDAQKLADLLFQLHSFSKPIVTMAQGSILGGGLGLLACSDIVVASDEASFCFSEVKIGLVPAVISPYIISILGLQAARYYFLTGERFNTLEAHRLGLVQQVVFSGDLEKAGQSLVQKLLKNSPHALTEIIRLMPWVAGQDISPALTEKTAEIFAKMRVSTEAREGLNAFLEKRLPNWS